MQYNEIISELKKLKAKMRSGFTRFIQSEKGKFYQDFILTNTKFLDETKTHASYEYSIPYRLWFLVNGIHEFPHCQNKNCNCLLDNPKYFLGYNKGYRTYCCIKHAATDEKSLQHRKETCIKKYGAGCVFQTEHYKSKAKQTNLERYGVEFYNNKDQARQTRLKNNNGKYHADDFPLKAKKTRLERYGDENYRDVSKLKKTLKEKYGVICSLNIKHVEELSALALSQRSYEKFILGCEYDKPCFSFEEYFQTHKDYNTMYEFECKKCGYHFMSIHKNGCHKRCPKCYPKIEGTSYDEKELEDFVISHLNALDVLTNTRKIIYPLELDLYIPNKKLAIEYDGLYWHSTIQQKNTNYHLMKTKLCEEKGIQLIHIFENEWLTKKDIVKSRLKNLLGIYDKTVFARKCEVREVDSKTSKAFQEDNHIQGAINAKVNVGLYYEDKLISLMTFSKARFSKKYEWEMLRFCNKLGYHIPGAAGKLLKHFEKTYNPKSLVSYADRRWSTGKLYKALGFTLDHISAPNYWYFSQQNSIESRVKYQKHKLKDILEKFDENKTEVQNMEDNGFFRIFDCGNLVFAKTYE